MTGPSIATRVERLVNTRRPPGPVGLPIIGPLWSIRRDALAFMLDTARAHGDVAFTRFAGMPTYLVSHPDGIERVLVTKRAIYPKGSLTHRFEPVLGNGLLLARGELWTNQRKLMAPAFHHRRVQAHAAAMVDATEEHIASWSPGVRTTSQDMMALTLDIAVRTLFGATAGDVASRVGAPLTELLAYFAKTLSFPVAVPLAIPIPLNRRFLAARAALDDVVYEIIRAKRASPGGDDLLSMLVELTDEEGRGMDDKQLRDEVLTLLLAGHETTALTMTFVFHLLGTHEDEDDALAEEVQRVLGDRTPTLEDLPKLVRVEQVVKEALRLYPPAAVLARQAIEDDELMGWPIPRGAQIVMPEWVTHRDPRWFDSPESFVPSRWTPKMEAALPRFAYFPFGGGPRVCIGNAFAMLEAKLVLATIARRFALRPVDARPLELITSVTIRPKTAVRMHVVARAN